MQRYVEKENEIIRDEEPDALYDEGTGKSKSEKMSNRNDG